MARYFQLSLYLLLLVSVLTLSATGKLDLFTALAAPAAVLVKGLRWWRGYPPEISARAANWLVIGYFFFFPLDLWWVSRWAAADAQNPALFAALLAAIHLTLAAMIVRLYSASTTRDYMFLSLLAFAAVLASAILTVDTAFLIFFFLFLVLAISTFIGLEMRRSAEGAASPPLETGTPLARRLNVALGITSAGVALAALAAGAVIFFMIPRVNAGYFSRFDLQPTLISGFSDDVELGQIGEIQRSSAVVMRIQVDEGPAAATGIHWRGVVLTTFDGRRWYTETHDPIATSESADGWTYFNSLETAEITGIADGTNSAEALRQAQRYAVPLHYTVWLEPMASDALFVAAEPTRIRGDFAGDGGTGPRFGRRSYLIYDKTGSLSNPMHNFATVHYDGVSALPHVPAAVLRAAPQNYSQQVRDLYLQLPELDPRIPALAKQIVSQVPGGGAKNPYDQAAAIEQYLRTRYTYTLDVSGAPPRDPLAYFLFERRAGHCEYFAAAMTVMLRTLGVPARYVNGFVPGEYNTVGGDFIVRASDAHSWVEAFFPGYGWITFDPTPGSNDSRAGLMAHLGLYWDWFELSWSEWVINYDFLHQFTLARNVGRTSRSWTASTTNAYDHARRGGIAFMNELGAVLSAKLERHLAGLPVWLTFLAIVLGLCALVLGTPALRERLALGWRVRGFGARSSLAYETAIFSYRRMLDLLAKRDWRKPLGQTPLEFAAGLPAGEIRTPALDLTELYLAARFGARPAEPQRFAALLGQLRAALRAHRA